MAMIYPVILAGGTGTRLWPVSTKHHPKQMKALLNNQTLLQTTYARLLEGFVAKDIFLVTNEKFVPVIQEQIDITEANIFVEPDQKGTAIAIGLAALKLIELDDQATIVTINTDHYIKEVDQYLQTIQEAGQIIETKQDKIILVGVKPDYPETGYGYIELDQEAKVKSFKEKPDLATAEQYIKSGYLWNAGIFVFKAQQLLKWYQGYLPEVYQALMNIKANQDIKAEYAKLDNISIDYGLLEKLVDRLVITADFKWADIGNWRSLRDIQLLETKENNISNTKHIELDSQNNLLYSFSNKLIATVGVEDMILVETDEVVFLCPASRAQDLKKLLTKMESNDLEKYL